MMLVNTIARDPEKAVVLVAGPCGHPDCGRSRDDALVPLLTQDSLAVWTHLITDHVTADRCLKLHDPGKGAASADTLA